MSGDPNTTEHDLVCNADKSLPRYESPGYSCRGREERAAQRTRKKRYTFCEWCNMVFGRYHKILVRS